MLLTNAKLESLKDKLYREMKEESQKVTDEKEKVVEEKTKKRK